MPRFQQQYALAKRPNPFILLCIRLAASAPFRALGQMLYNLGFAAELILVKSWRIMRDGGLFIAQLASWVAQSVWGGITGALRSFGQDFAAPFVRIRRNLHNLERAKARDRVLARTTGEAPTATRRLGYWGRGMTNYLALLANILRYLLPFAAIGVLVFTVNSLLSYRYALAVELDGRIIGYVADDMVLEEAILVVQGRIRVADGEEVAAWRPEGLSVQLTNVSTGLTNTNQFINNLMEFYAQLTDRPDALVNAQSLMVDGVLYAVTTEGEKVQEYLDDILKSNADPENPNAAISFVKDISTDLGENQYHFAESVKSADEIIEELSKIEAPAQYYTVEESQSLADVALATGHSTEELVNKNSQLFAGLDDEELVLAPGTMLLVESARPFLQVKKTVQEVAVEPVPYTTQMVNTEALWLGSSKVAQEGQDGLNRVYYDVVYIDGQQVDKIKLNEKTEILSAPTPEIIEVGTFEYTGQETLAEDLFLWPCNDYKKVSRGWGRAHEGIDIAADAYTPIIAANGGVVVVSGRNQEHWSYGICVKIQHGDTYETLYAHMIATNVSVGDVVKAGDVIGYVGSTGRSTGNHLHFEIRVNGAKVDPEIYIQRPR